MTRPPARLIPPPRPPLSLAGGAAGSSEAERGGGAVSAPMAVALLALLAVIGLGVDGSRAAQGMATADAIAEEAARAAGQALDSAALHRGTVAVDPTATQTAARAYLAAADTADPTRSITATVTVAAPDRLRVQVTATQATVLLGLIGMDTLTVHGSADAVLVPTAGATP
jgi:hypothetical protein